MNVDSRGGGGALRGAVRVLAGLVVVVLAAEALLWLLPRSLLPDGVALLDRVYAARSGWYRMMMGDPFLGYKLKPDLDMMFPSEGRDIPIRTRSYGLGEIGFRDVGTAPPFDGVAIGGSFTLCDDVPVEHCWVRTLSEAIGRSIATLGVNGYSTLASARMLERHGPGFAPKFVLVDLFLNDFKDNLNFDQWARSGSGNFWEWLRERRGRSELDRWLGEYSMLYRVVDGAVRARGRRIRPYRQDGVDMVFRLDGWWLQLLDDPEGNTAWPLMQQALLNVRDAAQRIGAKPLVLLFPMKEEVYWDRLRTLAPEFTDEKVNRPFDVIGEFCRAHGMPYCDLRPPLQAEARRGRQLYHRISSHWNDEGNRVAAVAIERCMREHGFVPAAGS